MITAKDLTEDNRAVKKPWAVHVRAPDGRRMTWRVCATEADAESIRAAAQARHPDWRFEVVPRLDLKRRLEYRVVRVKAGVRTTWSLHPDADDAHAHARRYAALAQDPTVRFEVERRA